MKKLLALVLLLMMIFPLFAGASEPQLRVITTLNVFALDYNHALFLLRGGKTDSIFLPEAQTVTKSGDYDVMIVPIEEGKAQMLLMLPNGGKDIITVAFVMLAENMNHEEFDAKDYIGAILYACELQEEVFDLEFSALKGVGTMGKGLELGDTGEYKKGLLSASWKVANHRDGSLYYLTITKKR